MPECVGEHWVLIQHPGLCHTVQVHNVAKNAYAIDLALYGWASGMKWQDLL